MRSYLMVWRTDSAPSRGSAARKYADLIEGKEASQEFDTAVYDFYAQLTKRYPELDTVPEDEWDSSPWASALEVSGKHVILAVQPECYASTLPLILQLADANGLVCFDPQNDIVHLPAHLRLS